MQRRRAEIVSSLLHLPAREVELVVELGCGPGALVASLAAAWPSLLFLGVDVEDAMVEHARRAHAAANLRFERLDLEREKPNVEVPAAFSVDLVHHVHDLHAFLRNVGALLVPGGLWVAIEPNVFHPYVFVLQERMRRRGLDEDHFRPWRFERGLRRAGLDVVSRRTAFVLPGSVQRVPRRLATLERAVERVPVLGGSIVYVLRAV
jgi:trans-aconitate 2-methyltransferase